MTPLREAMNKAMRMRGFSERTHHSYLMAVTDLARWTKHSPADLSPVQVNGYFEHLVIERGLAPASCRLFFHGIRFPYVQVLHWPETALSIVLPKRPQRIPQLLTQSEVARILGACDEPRYHMMPALCYGCGLRVSELFVQVSHLDESGGCCSSSKAKGPRTARCRCRRPCWNSCASIGLHPATCAQPLGRGP